MKRKPRPLSDKNLRRLPKGYRLDYDAMRFWQSLSVAERLRLAWKLHSESSQLSSTARRGSKDTPLTEAEIDEKLLYRLARKAKVEKDLLRIAKRAGWTVA